MTQFARCSGCKAELLHPNEAHNRADLLEGERPRLCNGEPRDFDPTASTPDMVAMDEVEPGRLRLGDGPLFPPEG